MILKHLHLEYCLKNKSQVEDKLKRPQYWQVNLSGGNKIIFWAPGQIDSKTMSCLHEINSFDRAILFKSKMFQDDIIHLISLKMKRFFKIEPFIPLTQLTLCSSFSLFHHHPPSGLVQKSKKQPDSSFSHITFYSWTSLLMWIPEKNEDKPCTCSSDQTYTFHSYLEVIYALFWFVLVGGRGSCFVFF